MTNWKTDKAKLRETKESFYRFAQSIVGKIDNPSGKPPRVMASRPINSHADWLQWLKDNKVDWKIRSTIQRKSILKRNK